MMNISNLYNKVRRMAVLPFFLLVLCPLLTSCNEDNDTVEEFVDWQNKNQQYFNNIYNTAKQKIAAGDTSWKIFRSYSLVENAATQPTNFIVVHVLEKGTGSGCPLYSDTTRVHYSGRLIPSTSYANGYTFDTSWNGSFNPLSSKPLDLSVGGTVNGWATALMQMHIGDRWEVYVPYQLGYGTTSTSSGTIPAYSTLIFDIRLVGYWRAGATVPDVK